IRAYTEMGLLQGSQYEENLGDVSDGIATLTKATTLAQQLVGHSPANVTYLASYAAAEKALGEVYFTGDEKQKAFEHLTHAAEISQQVSATPGVTAKELVGAASILDGLGDTLGLPGIGTMNDPVKAIERYKQSLAVYRQGMTLDPACSSCIRGVAVEDYKLGMQVEDKVQAAAFNRDGLTVLATLAPAERTTTRNLRADNLLRQNLGVLDIDLGKTAEGLAMMETVQQRMRAAVAADPVDARAKNDLALFDGKLASSYDDLGQYAQERDALTEFISLMDALTHKNPANSVWKFRRALALSRYGQVQLRLGKKDEGVRAGKESLDVLLPLAQKPDAESRVLSIASVALVAFHPKGKLDGPLAVSLAQRTIAGKQRPEVEDYVTLAQAQALEGSKEESKSAAMHALKLLPMHGQSLSDANDRILVESLIRSAETSRASR
ncbi:MAG: tetratricopeptide repeat protein, partial [Bryocella sp.]